MQQLNDVYSVGKVGCPAASPTSVLEEDAAMTSWAWDSSNAPSSKQESPIRSSPMRSSSSQSHDALRTQDMEQLGRGRGGAPSSSSSKTLVETLQTCLTSLPSNVTAASGTAMAPATVRDGSAMTSADPSGAATTLRQSRIGAAVSGSSKPLGPTKPAKRRSRASRRTPTTVLEADSSAFRDMVQKLTGIAETTKGDFGTHVVRPQPKRAGPGTFDRTDPLQHGVLPTPSPFPHPVMPVVHRTSQPPFQTTDHIAFLQQLQRSTSEQVSPFITSSKRELEGTLPYGSVTTMTRTISAPVAPMPMWWDAAHERPQNTAITMSRHNDSLTNEAGRDPGASKQLPGGLETPHSQITPEDQELSISQIESWLHIDTSAEMRVL